MADEICIISAPGASSDQLNNLAYALKGAEVGVYITKASLQAVGKKDILNWIETLLKIAVDEGWTEDVKKRMKKLK